MSIASSGGQLARTTGRDGVVATFHFEGGRIIFMTLGFVVTSGGGVIAVLAQAMCPAIVHLATLDSDVSCRSWRSRGDGGCRRSGRRRWRRHSSCLVCAVEACKAGSELTNAFLVTKLKLGLA